MLDLRRVLNGYMPRMSHVYRYSSIPVTRRESIAEHSWWVAYLCMIIGQDLKGEGHQINIEALLSRAILHDIDETMSGDIIRSFKHTDREVLRAIQEASEVNVLKLFDVKTYGLNSRSYFNIWDNAKDHTLEGDILKFADQMAVIFYCVGEHRMGNQSAAVVLEELYTNWFEKWHDHVPLNMYSAQLFPNNLYYDAFGRDPEDLKPIMRTHSEGDVSEHVYETPDQMPLS